jgi:hypothetical protein
MGLSKNKTAAAARSSVGIENGNLSPTANKTPNLINLDETKRTTPKTADNILSQPQYGKTLNVPDTNAVQALPIVTPAAPITPPRPAIMTTPKSATATTPKNPAAEIRPLLLVTAANDQKQPQTTTVPNSRRLPVNGRLALIAPTKPRQQSIMTNNHQMINEITPKKHINDRPRTALYFTTPTTRMKIKQFIYLFIEIIYLENSNQSSEQHQILLNNVNNPTNRHDSIGSHTSTDDGIDHWSVAPK